MSSNGRTIAWGSSLYPSAVFTSLDDGLTWKSNSMPFYVTGLAVSADGANLASACLGQVIYTSTNSGNSWQPSSSPATSWKAITSSADGNTLVAAANYGSATQFIVPGQRCDVGFQHFVPGGLEIFGGVCRWRKARGCRQHTFEHTGADFPLSILAFAKTGNSGTNGSTVVSWTIPSQAFVLQSSSNLESGHRNHREHKLLPDAKRVFHHSSRSRLLPPPRPLSFLLFREFAPAALFLNSAFFNLHLTTLCLAV